MITTTCATAAPSWPIQVTTWSRGGLLGDRSSIPLPSTMEIGPPPPSAVPWTHWCRVHGRAEILREAAHWAPTQDGRRRFGFQPSSHRSIGCSALSAAGTGRRGDGVLVMPGRGRPGGAGRAGEDDPDGLAGIRPTTDPAIKTHVSPRNPR